MNNGLFVDTSGWAGLIHRQDPFHAEADRLYREAFTHNRRILTTDYVLAELVPLLGSHYKLTRPAVIAAVGAILSDPHIAVLRTDPATFDAAWRLLTQRQDKEWSVTDAISFVVMGRLGLNDALTSDRHFEQAGFVRLLK
jgi:predicted nucleic acid-binding protein